MGIGCILFRACRHRFIFFRSIMTTSAKLDKVLENLKSNPYFNKYADRIATLQKTSPEEFLERVEKQEQTREQKKKNNTPLDIRQFSSVLNPKRPLEDIEDTEDVKLESILRTDLVKDKNANEIQAIWEGYHQNKHVISATIPIGLYKDIQELMIQFNTFLFPLPRSQGYEFIMCQTLRHSVHFTPLLAYQVHKENAPECLKMVHYTELSEKGIVLMRGEYDKNVLTGQEAQCLANQFQMYYCGKDETKLKLLESFTKSPETFKHMDLIAQLENITFV